MIEVHKKICIIKLINTKNYNIDMLFFIMVNTDIDLV